MGRVISVHEYELKSGVTSEQFERAVKNARSQGLFKLPGLIGYHFLKRIRGTRKVEYAAIWIYENLDSWEALWGKADHPQKKENYPDKWQIWENEILAPLLRQAPDHIYYVSYTEF